MPTHSQNAAKSILPQDCCLRNIKLTCWRKVSEAYLIREMLVVIDEEPNDIFRKDESIEVVIETEEGLAHSGEFPP